jgi:phthalate 4,5-dioxygenase oxygenase subunit
MRAADNELLTRVGPGTAMGALLRQYWMPVLLCTDLAGRDDAPLRVRLLGENLVAFRSPGGEIGLIAEGCPHRGASLALARVETGGLRCIYHGWKFDRAGRCLDMPNEPLDRRFTERVRARAYPCRERNGVVWAYLGPRDEPPPLPELEWNLLPAHFAFQWRMVRECNWLQTMEGDLDSSHIAILHATLDDPTAPTVPDARMPGVWSDGMRLARASEPPLIEAVETPYGALCSARRPLADGRDYHRIHPFLMPFHTMVGGAVRDGASARRPLVHDGTTSFNGKAWLPIDDTRTLVWEWQLRPDAPWTDDERAALARVRYPHGFLPATDDAAGAFRSAAHAGNDYLRDRRLEQRKLFCGILSNPLQDAAVQESMGAIVDRTQEHLGPADAMIVCVRRRLLAAALELNAHGVTPSGVDQPELYRVRPFGALLPRDADWLASACEQDERTRGT